MTCYSSISFRRLDGAVRGLPYKVKTEQFKWKISKELLHELLRMSVRSKMPSKRHRSFCSVLFYSITLDGRRGTTDEFATAPLHLVLFSAALDELAKSILVHSLILSSHLFFCLPLFLFPFTVPFRIVFAKPEDLETWPNHLSFRVLNMVLI